MFHKSRGMETAKIVADCRQMPPEKKIKHAKNHRVQPVERELSGKWCNTVCRNEVASMRAEVAKETTCKPPVLKSGGCRQACRRALLG